MLARPDRVGAIHRAVDGLQRENAALVAERFPSLNRCLTGDDLAHIRRADGRLDLNAILCGSEGTLGFLAEATLNLLPLPAHMALVTRRYASFDAALRDARALAAFGAASIERLLVPLTGRGSRDVDRSRRGCRSRSDRGPDHCHPAALRWNESLGLEDRFKGIVPRTRQEALDAIAMVLKAGLTRPEPN